ncbi:MAG: homoserine kinase [Pseudomonadota bacterium]
MAVYTDVNLNELSAVLQRFDLGELRSSRGIAEGVENSNYLIETDKARYILTLYEKRVAAADLPFFLGLMEHLAGNSIPCPLPMHDEKGMALVQLSNRPAALISYLDGVSIDQPSQGHCHQVGTALADLHAAQTGFTSVRANALSLDGWRDLAASCLQDAAKVEPNLPALITDELSFLAKCWPDADVLPSGVIHADLFPDNVFFLHGTLSGIIDFYFACNDMLSYDLAICLNAWCFNPNRQFLPAHAEALIAGYSAKRPLTRDEQDILPLLCRGAAMRFLLTRLYDWLNPAPGALVKPKDPLDYVARLKFFQTWGFP